MQHDTSSPHATLPEEFVASLHGKHAARIERLLDWLSARQITQLDRFVFLAFAETIGSRCVLVDVAKTLKPLQGTHAALTRELAAAVRDHRRRCDRVRMITEIVSAPWWKPFLGRCDVDQLGAVELGKIDDWLAWMYRRKITDPSVEDFLTYASRWKSAEPLESLHRHLMKLGVVALPTTEVRLSAAIVQKRLLRSRKDAPPRARRSWPRSMSVAASDLPKPWRDTLTRLGKEAIFDGKPTVRAGMLPSTERALRAFCWVCRKERIEERLSTDTVMLYERQLQERGCRAATREIQISLLLRFMLNNDPDNPDITAIRSLHRRLVADAKREVPLKFSRLAAVGGTKTILRTAVDLLSVSEKEESCFRRSEQLNAAVALALFTLLPLRVSDSNLRWGRNIRFSDERYHVFVRLSKSGERFSSPLCEFLTPFLDALILQGCDPRFLNTMREDKISAQGHLFAHANSRKMSENRVSNLWSRHIGCGVHIARTLVHTELGKLGEKGISEALALCAHRHPSTARFYQGKAMADALLLKGANALKNGFSDIQIAQHFPDLDRPVSLEL